MSVKEISVLIDTNIFPKGDGIIFNVQETIFQRIARFKKHRKYKMMHLKLRWCGLCGQYFLAEIECVSCLFICFLIFRSGVTTYHSKNQCLLILSNSCQQRICKLSECSDTYKKSSTWNSSSTKETQNLFSNLPFYISRDRHTHRNAADSKVNSQSGFHGSLIDIPW